MGWQLFWSVAWQSALFLAFGLAASGVWRRRPARAHLVLWLAVLAALLTPLLRGGAGRLGLGLLPAEIRAVPHIVPQAGVPRTPTRAIARTVASTPSRAGTAPDAPAAETAEGSATPLAAAAAEDAHSRLRPLAGRDTPHRASVWIYGAWPAASLLLLSRLVQDVVRGRRLVALAGAVAEERLAQAAAYAARQLRIDVAADVRVWDGAQSPAVWCWSRRPILLVPRAALCGDVDWRGVFVHELAHWKRRDHWSSLTTRLLTCFLPWQPLGWWANRRLAAFSEMACDDWTLQSGLSRTQYAMSLLSLAPTPGAALTQSAVGPLNLYRRIDRILHHAPATAVCGRAWTAVWTAVVIAASALVAVGQQATATRQDGESTAVAVVGDEGDPLLDLEQMGTVRGLDGLPLSGVIVESLSMEHRATARTDQDGRYRVAVRPPRIGQSWLFARTADDAFHAYVRLPRTNIVSAVDLLLRPTQQVTVAVRSDRGHPVENALVVADVHYFPVASARTNGDGLATFRALVSQLRSVAVFRDAAGMAFQLVAEEAAQRARLARGEPIQLTLRRARPLNMLLLDRHGEGIAGVHAHPPRHVGFPDGTSYELPLNGLLEDELFVPTDEEGVATFAWFPDAARSSIVNQFTMNDRVLMIVGAGITPTRQEFRYVIDRPIRLRGRVTLPNGEPASRIGIAIAGAPEHSRDALFRMNESAIDGGFLLRDGFRPSQIDLRTGADGWFEALVMPNHVYMVAVRDADWAAPARQALRVEPETPIEDCSFQLEPAVRVTVRLHGRVSRGDNGSPLEGVVLTLRHWGMQLEPIGDSRNRLLVEPQRPYIEQRTVTNSQGEYEFQVEPGEYELQCTADHSDSIADLHPSTHSRRFVVGRDGPRRSDFSVRIWPRQDAGAR